MKSLLLLTFLGTLSWSVTAQTGNEVQGAGSGVSITTGDYNTFYGDSSGTNHTSGLNNTYIGEHAGYSSTSGSDNTFIGQDAGRTNTTGTDNTYIGKMSGNLSVGTDNTFIGCEAGMINTTGYDNTFIGEESGQANVSGHDNTFLGEDSGFNNTTGDDNTFVGSSAGRTNTTGRQNAFFGNDAGYDNTTGIFNTFIGDSAGTDNSIGVGNTFLGHAAGAATEYSSFNTFVGHNAGWDNNRTNATTGEALHNTYIGANTGYTNREGNYNVGLGAFADFRGTGYTGTGDNIGTVFIGYESMVDEQESVAIGYYSRVYGRGTVAIGAFSDYDYNSTDYTVGLGWTGHANNASNAVGIGREHYLENATNSIGIGALVNITANYGTAIGYNAVSSAEYAASYGYEATVAAPKSIVLGYGAHIDDANALNSIAIGHEATALDSNTMILGNNSNPLRLGIGTTAPNKFAAIDLAETSKGFMLNRLTNAQRTALEGDLSTTEEGLMVYDTEDDKIYTWDGTAWTTSSITEVDGSITNEIQDISLAGSNLTISNGSTIDLSSIDTDTQLSETEVDAFVANNGYLTSFTEVDGSITNEIQDISLAGSNLTISNGSTIDLSGVDTDEQDLTAATLLGTTLEIEIENGSSVSVDLAPLLSDLQNQINDLEIRIVELESCACDSTSGIAPVDGYSDNAILYQNIPNPFNNTSSIKYYIPTWANSANLVISDGLGQVISNIEISEVGTYGNAYVNAAGLTPGTYYYTLYVNQSMITTKKMIIQ